MGRWYQHHQRILSVTEKISLTKIKRERGGEKPPLLFCLDGSRRRAITPRWRISCSEHHLHAALASRVNCHRLDDQCSLQPVAAANVKGSHPYVAVRILQ